MNLYQSVQRGWRHVPERYRERVGASRLVKTGLSWIKGRYASHDELYNAPYFAGVDKHARQSAPVMADSIVEDLAPAHVLDVGCGTGALLAELAARGVAASGLEYSTAALEYCRTRGLDVQQVNLEEQVPLHLADDCDVTVSMEVAEHLPGEAADGFVRLLCRAQRAVVFTAATPGQGGSDHVNEQPAGYWIAKFARQGFTYDDDRSQRWRARWHARGVTWWYARNVMVFVRQQVSR